MNIVLQGRLGNIVVLSVCYNEIILLLYKIRGG